MSRHRHTILIRARARRELRSIAKISSLSLLIDRTRRASLYSSCENSDMTPRRKTEDIVIVGGGIMGVCSAYFLTQSEEFRSGDLNVVVVEEGEIFGGASGKAAGFLARDWHDAATESLGAFSYDLYESLAEQHNGEKAFGYRKVKSYAVNIKSPSQRQSATKLAEDAPPPTRDLPAEHHWLSLPEGQVAVLGAGAQGDNASPLSWLDESSIASARMLSDEGTTAQVDSELFGQTLWIACLDAGVTLVQGRAKGISQAADGSVREVTVQQTSDGSTKILPADRLVLAAGPWTGSLAKELFPALTSQIAVPIKELPGHSIIFKAPHPLPAEAVFCTMRDADATTGPECFTRPDGTIYVAGENSGAPLPLGTYAVSKDENILHKLRRAVDIIAPSLAALSAGKLAMNANVVKTQLCYRPISTRGTPVLGRLPGAANVIVCSGMGPWGITLGPGSGKVVSELVLDRTRLSASIEMLAL